MNAAIPHAWTVVGVRALVVASHGEVVAEDVALEADYPFDPPYTDQPPMEAAVAWEGDAREGFAGWTAFDLRGEGVPTNPENGTGDYVRGMGVELVPAEDAPGALTVDVSAELTTSSALELTDWRSSATGTLVRIGEKGVTCAHYEVTGDHPVGAAETGPTLDLAAITAR
jgi:hypothetical protein